jgi:hypothetical protein
LGDAGLGVEEVGDCGGYWGRGEWHRYRWIKAGSVDRLGTIIIKVPGW